VCDPLKRGVGAVVLLVGFVDLFQLMMSPSKKLIGGTLFSAFLAIYWLCGNRRPHRGQKIAKDAKAASEYFADKFKRQKKERTAAVCNVWNKMSFTDRQLLINKLRASKEEMTTRLESAMKDGVDVCIDLAYADSHSELEIKSLARQVINTYAMLKKTTSPVHLHLSSLASSNSPSDEAGAATREALIKGGLQNWLISKHETSPWEIWPECDTRSIVVLSPDAPEALDSFSKDCIYIVGGIVDKSVRGGQTLRKAQEHNAIVRRLPLKEFAPENKSFALNVDCVCSIICTHLETNDWKETLRQCLPVRKVKVKNKSKRDQNDADETEVDISTSSIADLAKNSRVRRWVEREIGLANPAFSM
jgi:tRNA (guanine9-N1)-methyltransferase